MLCGSPHFLKFVSCNQVPLIRFTIFLVHNMSKKRPTNIIIVSNPRSGSTLLVNMLDGHSQYNCDGELFHPMHFEKGLKGLLHQLVLKRPVQFVLYRSLKCPSPFKRGHGFKVFDYQVPNLRRFVRTFYKKGYKIVLLERKNLLKQAFSKYIAREKNVWVIRKEEQQITSVFKLDPVKIVNFIEEQRKQQHINRWALKELPVIYVEYERDLATKEKQEIFWEDFCKTLEINCEAFNTNVMASDKRKDEDRIENFNEIIEYLNTHGYEKEVAEYFAYQTK